ncbi:SRP14 protein, partial [Polypterus senegalus]|nr:SRP14 protein [Polypterus senegalus]
MWNSASLVRSRSMRSAASQSRASAIRILHFRPISKRLLRPFSFLQRQWLTDSGQRGKVLRRMFISGSRRAACVKLSSSLGERLFCLKAMVLLENDSKCRTSGSVYITLKKYDGRTKPVPRKGHPETFEPADNKCLLRATDGKKKITTVVSSKEVIKFQMQVFKDRATCWLNNLPEILQCCVLRDPHLANLIVTAADVLHLLESPIWHDLGIVTLWTAGAHADSEEPAVQPS